MPESNSWFIPFSGHTCLTIDFSEEFFPQFDQTIDEPNQFLLMISKKPIILSLSENFLISKTSFIFMNRKNLPSVM